VEMPVEMRPFYSSSDLRLSLQSTGLVCYSDHNIVLPVCTARRAQAKHHTAARTATLRQDAVCVLLVLTLTVLLGA
jgi:hypothetical protein